METSTTSEPGPHNHGTDFIYPGEDFDGHPVDTGLLADLVGSAMDGCPACQTAALTRVSADPTTTARLVSVTCVALQGMMGGLPHSLWDENSPTRAATPEFRALARAGIDREDEAEVALNMRQTALAQTPQQRRNAADAALDLLTGLLA